ncbi:uncharacterized protein Z518_10363 [Rhinocladiella mackenziei CBS 650.93]|uniref:CWH43-like N-terminal domain-containing protein n=1 Tax=Rhinocladiella mackenziei CBS 650.93 TaxID=1442369 RepID=A0A0D2I369_9EURO|nr:uncharacterized protein Z518_10363 [Rhinocladiella mackenziei CBS 650.93]KIX00224.1 hypothetical protein Z518_10363 [Rhinocladiella mackenziei CBS 650.93]
MAGHPLLRTISSVERRPSKTWFLGSWFFPLISACMWLGMLLALFCVWEADGHPHLPSMDKGQTIAYISDTAAFGLKPLFITGSVITTVFLDLGFIAERYLRHTGRLAPNTSMAQEVLSALAIFFAIAGSAGLILLSIFDTYRHEKVHDGCLLLFIAGFVLSAVFLCAEYQRLGAHYRNHPILRISFWVKLSFILIEVALAVVFAATSWNDHQNVAAVFEWIIALVFTGYILSFLLDLLPSARTPHHLPQGIEQARLEKDRNAVYGSQQPPLMASTAITTRNMTPSDDLEASGYRGTAMTNGAGARHPAQHNDLGRQKKWGIGRFRI